MAKMQSMVTAIAHKARRVLVGRQARREVARRHFRAFVDLIPPANPYTWGTWNTSAADLLEGVTRSVESGTSRYVIICSHPGSGKSDLYCRRYGPWHLGRNPDHEIILATYGDDLAQSMNRDARRCFRSEEYRRTFHHAMSREQRNAARWEIEGHKGRIHACGIGGSVTGHRGNLIIIDDYLKSREAAESIAIREGVWDCFQSDLMTRRTPVCGVIIGANRWHQDDLVGRILRQMERDPAYPRFELHAFPAWQDERGWLFPERYSAQWYEQARATGQYAWDSQWQQNPAPRGGNILKTEALQFYDAPPLNLVWWRGWDLASTEKQRFRPDPDWTAGVKLATNVVGGKPHLWIDDVRRLRATALKRNAVIVQCALDDREETGETPKVAVEAVAGYKDAADEIAELLRGIAVVKALPVSSELPARATAIEPMFEAGNVHLRRGAWNSEFVAECGAFPKAPHDDQVAALLAGYSFARKRQELWVA